MGKEIERKFLVVGNEWRQGKKPMRTCQGYLAMAPECTVRVRLQEDHAFLTIKGKTVGMSRPEYEYEIPLNDARELMAGLCLKPCIEKDRYHVFHAGMRWEVDVFLQENEGLVVAEVELESEEQEVELPTWVGEEVTDDPRYRNSNLVKNPYSRW